MPRAALSATAPAASLQVFRPGRHVPLSGQPLEFAESDLAATAGAYDPAKHQAPLVVGHPKTDSPAYGWVTGLSLRGGALEATPGQVNPEFAAAVNAGSYKKISAAFWAPDAPGNPVPGVYYLRHVGFLGGVAPGVQGLRTPTFAGGETGVIEFASEYDDVDNASLWRSLRDWLLAKFGAPDADTAVPSYLVGSLERSAQAEVAEAAAESAGSTDTGAGIPAPAFAQRTTATESTVTEAQKAALEAENARLRQQLAEQAAANRAARLAGAHGEAVAFADGLVAQARLAVDHRDLVVAVFDTVAEQAETAGAVVEFGAGDAKAPLLPALRLLLAELPPRVATGRVATVARAVDGAQAGPEFAAPDGLPVDAEQLAMHRRVLAYRAAHPEADYAAALTRVLAGAA